MITRDLRRALARAVAAAGFEAAAEPGLRPTGTPASTPPASPSPSARTPRDRRGPRRRAAGRALDREPEVTGPGYLTVTVTPETLAAVADAVTAAGPACVTSDALAGVTVPAATPGDPLAAPTWEKARAALAARLTVSLAAAAGATVADPAGTERNRPTSPGPPVISGFAAAPGGRRGGPRRGHLYPGEGHSRQALRLDEEIMARRVPANPPYAVRYAHARAASGVRWAVSPSAGYGYSQACPARPLTRGILHCVTRCRGYLNGSPLPARRERPDEFARYLEDLASVTVDVVSSASHQEAA